MGALGSTARSLAAKSQTNLVLSVRSACFATQERNAPCSRLMLMSSAIGEASRRIAGVLAGRSLAAILPVLADMRSIAASAVFGCARMSASAVSPVCDRRNEREHPAKSAKLSAAASGAGAKLVSLPSGAGGTVRKR